MAPATVAIYSGEFDDLDGGGYLHASTPNGLTLQLSTLRGRINLAAKATLLHRHGSSHDGQRRLSAVTLTISQREFFEQVDELRAELNRLAREE